MRFPFHQPGAFMATYGLYSAVHLLDLPLFLDPVRFIGTEVPTPARSLSCRHVAAYIVRVGAKLARVAPDPSRLESLRLPPASQMAQGTPHGAVELGSDDEAWLCDDPPPASLPPAAPTPRSARWGARPKPVSVWRGPRLALFFLPITVYTVINLQ